LVEYGLREGVAITNWIEDRGEKWRRLEMDGKVGGEVERLEML
jgi:hypothetical protein